MLLAIIATVIIIMPKWLALRKTALQISIAVTTSTAIHIHIYIYVCTCRIETWLLVLATFAYIIVPVTLLHVYNGCRGSKEY